MPNEPRTTTEAEHSGPEVATGAQSLSGGHIGPEHTGPEVARGAESLSGGAHRDDHEGREIAGGAESLSGQTPTPVSDIDV